jgi:hypothetical protein
MNSLFNCCFLYIFLFYTPTLVSQVSFLENSAALGMTVSYGNSDLGGGVSYIDFNNDGWDDISLATEDSQEICFLKNNEGSLERVFFTGISNTLKTKQIIWVDYDNDGDKDLFVTALNGTNRFYKNDGNMVFTDISDSIGFFTENKHSTGGSFGDIDNDGDLDAFICNRDDENEVERNYLYQNNNGVYTDISSEAGIVLTSEISFCAVFFDYNNDGFQDIYVSNDKPTYRNRLYKNNGDNTFEDTSESSGAGIYINAMTTTIGDYNSDGWFDIYVTNTPDGNQLLRNNGDGTFTDYARETGTNFDSVGWGAVFLDADNDSNLDLYVSGTFDGTDANLLPSAFYHNQGNDTFIIPNEIGFENDNRKSYANAIGDIDNDGKPDIVVSNDSETSFLFNNKSTSANNWIKIQLEGTNGNKDGIGNRIEVFADGKSQYRYTLCGEGYLSQNSSYEFLGLSTASIIDYIKVTWNHSGIVETIQNVNVNQAITIQENNGILGVSNFTYKGLNIYPNPSDDGIYYLKNSRINEETKIEVYTITGRFLFSVTKKDSFNLSLYEKGIYIVKMITNDHSTTQKVLYL